MQNAKQQLEALRMRGEQVSSSLGKDKSERNALGATETFSDCGPTSPSWHNVCKRENAEKAVRNSKRAALDLRIQSLTQEEGNIERAKAVLVQTQDVSTEETDVVGQADQREEALL